MFLPAVLVKGLAVLVGVPGLRGCWVPLESSCVAVEVAGPCLPNHPTRHRLAQDLFHHGDVFTVVVRLKQGVSLQKEKNEMIIFKVNIFASIAF